MAPLGSWEAVQSHYSVANSKSLAVLAAKGSKMNSSLQGFRRFGRRAVRRTLKQIRLLFGTVWAYWRQESLEKYCCSIDPDLWWETTQNLEELYSYGSEQLRFSKVIQGGPGAVPLIYFLTRYLRPACAVETGVASGWSTAAFLSAMDKNSSGQLFSSDLPYPDREGSELAVGLVVSPKFRERWRLFLGPDCETLPKLLRETGSIELFHYDSDKSPRGREFAARLVWENLAEHAAIIFDDVQDNLHFATFVKRFGLRYHVFGFQGKFVGLALR